MNKMVMGSKNILLIEDNPGDAVLIREYLSESKSVQYSIDHVCKLSLALEKLDRFEYDVILLDLGLPDNTGLKALEVISSKAASIPVIILTGQEDEELALKAVQMSAQDYLSKNQIDGNLLTRSIRYAIERKKSEERLRENGDHYQSLFENNKSVMLLVDTVSGAIVDVNSAACSFYGYDRNEFLKLNITEINRLPEAEVFERMDSAYSEGRRRFIFKHHLKNGEIRDVEVFTGPINKGNKRLLYSIVHDITERKKAEDALKDSEYRYKTLFENAGDAIFIRNMEGQFLEVNGVACERLGYSKEELLRMRPEDINIPEKSAWVSRRIKELNINGHGFSTTIHLRKDGSTIPTEISSSVIEYLGQPAVISIARDITERKRAEEEILRALEKEKELNELKSRFVSMISHEYRTPLTSILSSVELLELFGYKWSEEKKKEHISKIKQSISYMTDMLNDVLLINRVEAGRLQFSPDSFELVGFCRHLANEIQTINKSKCRIHFSSNLEKIITSMDRKLLQYIINNLLTNAVNYSPHMGEVKFELVIERTSAVFKVADNGIGVPEEDKSRLFEQFYRGKNTSNNPGTGLGLSIVKRCVELHRGKIEFESDLGAGTTFTVTLPIDLAESNGNQLN